MNWLLQAYMTDTARYFVSRRGPNDWVVLDPSATIYEGFSNENAAMAFAESLDQRSAGITPAPSQTVTPV
jgi:hypothetical protein